MAAELSTSFTGTSDRLSGTFNSNQTFSKMVQLVFTDSDGNVQNIPASDITRIVITCQTTSGSYSTLNGKVLGIGTDGSLNGNATNRPNGYTYQGDELRNLGLVTGGSMQLYLYGTGCSTGGSTSFQMKIGATVYWTDPAAKTKLLVSSTSYSIIGSLNFVISNRVAGTYHRITIKKGSKTSSTTKVITTGSSSSGVLAASFMFDKTKHEESGTGYTHTYYTYDWDDRSNNDTAKTTFNLYIYFETFASQSDMTNNTSPILQEYYSVDGKEAMVITIPKGPKYMKYTSSMFTATCGTENNHNTTWNGLILQNHHYAFLNGSAVGAYGTELTLYFKADNQTINTVSAVNASGSYQGLITESGTVTYRLSAVDTLNNQIVITKSFTVRSYFPPSILEYSVSRKPDDPGKTIHRVVFNYTPLSGTYNSSSFKNYVNIKWNRKYHENANYTNTTAYINARTTEICGSNLYSIAPSNSTYTASFTSSNNLPLDSIYDFKIMLYDSVSDENHIVEREYSVGSEKVFMRWDKTLNSFGFGVAPSGTNELAIAEDWTFRHGTESFKSNSGSPYYWFGTPYTESSAYIASLSNSSANYPFRFPWDEKRQNGSYFAVKTITVNETNPTTNEEEARQISVIRCTKACVADVSYSVFFYKNFSENVTFHTRLRKRFASGSTQNIYGSFHRTRPYLTGETASTGLYHGQQFVSPTMSIEFAEGDSLDLCVYFESGKHASNGQVRNDASLNECCMSISVKSKA